MATKYAGQNALNKLMQLVKTALNNKADKTNATTRAPGLMSAADKTKLDGTAADTVRYGAAQTITEGQKSQARDNIDAPCAIGPILTSPVMIRKEGETASAGVYLRTIGIGEKTAEIRFEDVNENSPVAIANLRTPTGAGTDKYAATKGYVDSKVAAGGSPDAVLYIAQELTFEQKQQARKNIEAVSSVAPTTTGTVSMCPSKVTDSNDAAHVTTTRTSGDDFTVTLGGGPEDWPVRVKGIRTPTDADTDAAANVEYVKAKVASGGVTVDTEMSSTSPNPAQNKVVKSYVDTKVSGLQTADQVQAAISSAITGVYTPKGSIAFASLPTAAAGNKGWVYNVTNAFTTTAAFVEGAGHSYGAGTNVVCVDAGSGGYKWDVLAGIIDLTELTATEVQTLWDSI